MSTRASLWYTDEVHIYEELLEDDAVYIELTRGGVVVNFKLMTLDEWNKLTKTEPESVDTHIHDWVSEEGSANPPVCLECGARLNKGFLYE